MQSVRNAAQKSKAAQKRKEVFYETMHYVRNSGTA